jgi:hypothetical protein
MDSHGLRLFLTGHSLGASAVSAAYMEIVTTWGWGGRDGRLRPPVLFESPGLPAELLHSAEVAAVAMGHAS